MVIGIDSPIILFFAGFLYGLSLAAPPGPMNALIASRSLSSFREGFLTGLGAMTADLVLMIATYYMYNLIRGAYIVPIYIIGGAYMAILAISIARSRVGENIESSAREHNRRGVVFSYITSLALGITNPYQILWWLSAGLSFISVFGLSAIVGLFIAILVWIILFPLSIRAGYHYRRRLTHMAVKIFSTGVLLIFSALILYKGFSMLFSQ